jgi:ribosomal protein L39E
MAAVCQSAGMSCEATAYNWLGAHPPFAKAYREARQIQAHRLFDETQRVAEHATEKSWRKDKLRIDTIRGRVAKLATHRYGPKADREVEPTHQFWNVYVQKFGEPRESAELISSQELNPNGRGLLDPYDDGDDD